MKLLFRCKSFIKHNSPIILTVLSSFGVVATAVLSGRASIRAYKAVEEKKSKDNLTKEKVVKIAIPFYISTACVGFATILAMAGSTIISKKNQAALTSAYVLLSNSYREYRNKVKDIHGDSADMAIIEGIASEKFPEGRIPENKDIFYDQFSGRFFVSTTEDIALAIYHYNRNFALRGTANLDEFYDFLGIDHIPGGQITGFNANQMIEMGLTPWIDIYVTKTRDCDNREYNTIYFDCDPIVDYEEYDSYF